jgi:hypothetical protein
LAACSGGGITVGPGATAAGSDGVSGSVTYTEHVVNDDPFNNGHDVFDDKIVLTFKVNEPEEGMWRDAGSTYTRDGTHTGTCIDEHWNSTGTVNLNDDASLQVDSVDRAAGKVAFTAFIGAILKGTTGCPATAVNQSAMEWTNTPTCLKDDVRGTITGEPWGTSSDGGRTVVYNCSSTATDTLAHGQTIKDDITLTGQLAVAPRK